MIKIALEARLNKVIHRDLQIPENTSTIKEKRIRLRRLIDVERLPACEGEAVTYNSKAR